MNSDTTKDVAPSATGASARTYSAFWPLLLALVAFILILSWNVCVTVRQNSNLQNLKFQVWQATAQSAQAEQKLKAILSDLVALSAQDPEAAAIVKKYKITQNGPAAPETAAPKGEGTVKPADGKSAGK